MVGRHQPVTLAAMEGKFVGGPLAGVAVIGQPNVAARKLDNPRRAQFPRLWNLPRLRSGFE